MFAFICSTFQFIMTLFYHDSSILVENLLLKKEVQILKRKLSLKRVRPSIFDRIWLSVLFSLNPSAVMNNMTLFSPCTVLSWQKRLIASFWTFTTHESHPGRPPIPDVVKELILSIKNNNPSWGAKRIRDELLFHCGIDLHKKTIREILKVFRRQGKIRKTMTWKQFLSSQIDSIFAMDFFTVDTIFSQRFYIFFIIGHKTREIAAVAMTQIPSREFVRQQLIEFQHLVNRPVYLIHDNAQQFLLDYSLYGIRGVATSVEAPNMNAIAERFVKSIRNEALDNFLTINERQISNIVKKYIQYYNAIRPHQGISNIPRNAPPPRSLPLASFSPKSIRTKSLLDGAITHFYREVA